MTKKLLYQGIILFLLFFLTTHSVTAQFSIKGTVYDDFKEPLIGASVLIKGTVIGTVTDLDGKFAIESPDSTPVLIITYTGFKNKEVSVKGLEVLTVQLSEESLALSEVVVTTSRRREKAFEAPSSMSVLGARRRSAKSIAAAHRPTVAKKILEGTASSLSIVKNVPIGDADEYLKSGTLTAGEINDFTKWDLWEDIAKEDLEEWQQYWQINPLERYALQLSGKEGFPVVDAKVALVNQFGQVLHQTRTDNTGKAELWANLFEKKSSKENKYKIIVDYHQEQYTVKNVKAFQDGINTLKLSTSCQTPQNLDIMMVVDATGSMGDELAYLKTELTDVIQQTQTKHQDLSINLGSVVYRDHEEDYLTRKSDFSTDISQTINFLKKQTAAGGGDHPEAVEHALVEAIEQVSWSKDAVARLLFLVLDAPPHHTPEIIQKIHHLAKKAAEKSIKIIPITGSGIGKSTEYLMRCLSLTTNGTYVFLTDDSGVGNPHLAPTTDTYKVEFLNALLVRLVNQYVNVTDCTAPIASLQNTGSIDNTAKIPKKLGLKIYPNPTMGPLTITAKKDIENTFLTDVSGKILARFPKWKKGTNNINLGQYPSGFYFLQFKTKEEMVSRKVLVNHQMVAGLNNR